MEMVSLRKLVNLSSKSRKIPQKAPKNSVFSRIWTSEADYSDSRQGIEISLPRPPRISLFTLPNARACWYLTLGDLFSSTKGRQSQNVGHLSLLANLPTIYKH